jgi:hypothetical protein
MAIDQLLLNRGVLIEEVLLTSLDTSDRTFALGDDDLTLIEESLAHDGQLDPVIARRQGERWQVIDGFRRLAAAERLGWQRVKVRLFDELSDEDAARMTTRHAVTALPQPDALEALATRLPEGAAEVVRESAHRFERRSDVSMEEAAAAPAAETEANEEEEVTLEDLAQRVVAQLSGISQDLALLQENWADITAEQRTQLRDLVRYTAELLPYLEE